MKKSMVVYWSQTGNTEAMAKAIGEGLKSTCEDSCVKTVSEVSASDLKDLEGFALGCPAMGDEVLEETEFVRRWKEDCYLRFIRLGRRPVDA